MGKVSRGRGGGGDQEQDRSRSQTAFGCGFHPEQAGRTVRPRRHFKKIPRTAVLVWVLREPSWGLLSRWWWPRPGGRKDGEMFLEAEVVVRPGF